LFFSRFSSFSPRSCVLFFQLIFHRASIKNIFNRLCFILNKFVNRLENLYFSIGRGLLVHSSTGKSAPGKNKFKAKRGALEKGVEAIWRLILF